jgi:hypothetical protein
MNWGAVRMSPSLIETAGISTLNQSFGILRTL